MIDKKAIAIVLCALAPTSIVGYIALQQTSHISAVDQQVIRDHEIHEQLDVILGLVTDAETAVRGYTITGKDEYLKPYFAALPDIEKRLPQLEKLVQGNEVFLTKLRQTEQLIHAKLARVEHVIMLRKEKGYDAAAEFIGDGKGIAAMDKIRLDMRQLHNLEEQFATRGSNPADDPSRLLRVTAILTVFALGLVLCNIFFSRL